MQTEALRNLLLVFFAFLTLTQCLSQSQAGQDEILEDIFAEIGETNRYYVEIGFNHNYFEGGSGSNTFQLWERGWAGLLMDGDFANKTINLHREFVTSGNIVGLLQKYHVPLEPDYVSIDIDSADLWVLRAMLSVYRPRVISVEYNAHFGAENSFAFPDPSWMPILHEESQFSGTCFYGSSARALVLVALEHGYKVASVAPGLDLFFVRGTLWKDFPDEATRVATIDELMAFKTFKGYPHFWHPMTVEQAVNLVDYETFVRGGTVCEARARAASLLRKNAIQSGEKGCFSLLADMPIPNCSQRDRIGWKGITVDFEGEAGQTSSATFEFIPNEVRAVVVLRALSFVKAHKIRFAPGCTKNNFNCIAQIIADNALNVLM